MSLSLAEQRHIVARLLAYTLIADGVLANREVEALEQHGIAELVGIPAELLIQTIIDHCRDRLARPGGETVRVVDIDEVEHLLDLVKDPELRLLTCRAMLVLAKADRTISPPELTLLRHALSRWSLRLEDIS